MPELAGSGGTAPTDGQLAVDATCVAVTCPLFNTTCTSTFCGSDISKGNTERERERCACASCKNHPIGATSRLHFLCLALALNWLLIWSICSCRNRDSHFEHLAGSWGVNYNPVQPGLLFACLLYFHVSFRSLVFSFTCLSWTQLGAVFQLL